MASDVCKHCTHAGCLDVCPTGALFRTEFGTVVVQEDICNGCGYCIPACPYGVIDRREGDGRAWKCTMCYDRLGDGLEPACAKACPTESIQFGAARRAARARRRAGSSELHDAGRRPRPGSTAHDPTTASAATARSSCCSTSPRSTACRPTRSCRPATCPRCGATPRCGRAGAWPRVVAAAFRGRSGGESGGRPAPADRDGVDGAATPSSRSYYGRPILKSPTWKAPDIPLYLFLGGLARARRPARRRSPTLTGRPALRAGRAARGAGRSGWSASARSSTTSAGPRRFLHMLRVFKPTSPLSVGSWILSPFVRARPGSPPPPQLTGHRPGRSGRAAGLGGAALAARDGHLHRGPARRHRRPGLARGAPRAAVRLRGQRPRRARRPRHARRTPGNGPGRAARRRSGRRSSWPPPRCCERRIGFVGEPYRRAGRHAGARGASAGRGGRGGRRCSAGAVGCSPRRPGRPARGVGRHPVRGLRGGPRFRRRPRDVIVAQRARDERR